MDVFNKKVYARTTLIYVLINHATRKACCKEKNIVNHMKKLYISIRSNVAKEKIGNETSKSWLKKI